MAVRALPWATLTIPSAKKLNGVGSDADTRQISAAGAGSVVPLTYGQDRIGALLLNVGSPAPGNTTTLLIQVLWGFAGSGLTAVQLNGKDLPGGASVTTYLGTQTTADPTVVAAFAAYGITYTDTLEGYAYSVISVPQTAVSTEIQVTGVFSGRKLYDPRKDSTAGGSGAHRLATPSTWEYSDCPALALADFLRSSVYGAGETVDSASVATAANANDALIGSPSEKRRIMGVSFAAASSVTDTAEVLRAYAGCHILPGSSGIRLVPDQDDAHVATYTHADGAIASIAPLQLRDLGNSPTVVEVIYTDTSSTPWKDASAYAELAGVGTTRPYRLSQVRMPGVKRYSQAKREAIERLNKLTLQDLSTQIEVFDIGVRHEVADIIRVTHPIGLDLKKFRVTEVQNAAAGRWLLSLIEHDAACYSDTVQTAPTYNGLDPDVSDAPAPIEGLSTQTLTIYAQSPTQPACPTGGSYTFTGDVFVPPSADEMVIVGYAEQGGINWPVDVPAHAAGDLLVLFTRASGTNTPPAAISGWTSRAVSSLTIGNGWRVSTRVDTDNTINTLPAYMGTGDVNQFAVVVVRNATVGDVQIGAQVSSNTTTFPTLSLGGSNRLVISGASASSSSVSGQPSGMTLQGDNTTPNLGGGPWAIWTTSTTVSSFAGKTFTWGASVAHASWAIELVPTGVSWAREQPATTTTPTWKSEVLVTTRTPAVAIPIGSGGNAQWSCPPVLHAQLLPTQATITLVQRTTTSTPPTLPSADVTYTFATGVAAGLTQSWTQTLPTSGGPYRWATTATATSATATDVIAPAEWSAARITSQDGENTATVTLVRRTTTSTPPALPSANVTYTFATGVATGLTESWEQTLPTSGGSYRWATIATATSATATDVIAPAEWSAARITSQDGENADTYEVSFGPATIIAEAHVGGFVPSFAGLTTTASLKRNGVTETGDWTVTVLAHPHAAASVAGALISLTSMAAFISAVTLTVEFTRTGFPKLIRSLNVSKVQNLGVNGINPLALTSPSGAYSYTASTVYVGWKFTPDGKLYLGSKIGAAAWSFGAIHDYWALPVTAGFGNNYSLLITEEYNYSTVNEITGIALADPVPMSSDIIFGWKLATGPSVIRLGFRIFIVDTLGVSVDIGVMKMNMTMDGP